MRASPLRATLIAAVLGAATIPMSATALPSDYRASTWAVGVAGGGTNGITIARDYSYGRVYPHRAEGTVFAAVHLLHDLGGHFSAIGQATYLSFGPGSGSYRVQHVPVGIGVRYRFVTGSSHRGSPYIDVSPAIAWSRWREPFDRVEVSSFHPAMVAGLGAHGKLGERMELEIGLRYFLTSDGGTESRSPDGTRHRTLEGLNEAGVLVGLYYAL